LKYLNIGFDYLSMCGTCGCGDKDGK